MAETHDTQKVHVPKGTKKLEGTKLKQDRTWLKIWALKN